jgi:hypothetical protein
MKRKKRKKRPGRVDSPLESPGVALHTRRAVARRWLDPHRAMIIVALALVAAGAGSSLAVAAKEKKPLTRTVTGFVVDDAGKPIEGASVELTDAQTSKVLAIYSQQDGSYHYDGLSFSHDYKIQASFKGVSSETRQISSIDMRARLVLNLTIPGQKPQ